MKAKSINDFPASPTTIGKDRGWQRAPATFIRVLFAARLVGMAVTAIEVDHPERATAGVGPVLSQTNDAVSAISAEYGAGGLRINFHAAPLGLVLDYLSDAAGFIINKQGDARGNVELWSKQPVSKDEAVELLGSVLTKNGYSLTRNGRILTIMPSGSVKTADTEIVVSSDPGLVEKSDQVQTQVIPVRYATASQLVPNLEPLLPTSATLTANESANTLILVATKTDIKRMLRIVEALDTSLAGSASVKVRLLRYANAKDTASIVTQLFAPQRSNQTLQGGSGVGPNFGGPPGGGFAGGMNPDGNNSNNRASSSGRGSVAGRVTAVSDERSNSLIIIAPADLIAAIDSMVDKLDQPMGELTELRVFRLKNAEPSELADQLAQLFPDENNSNNAQAGDMPFFFPGAGGPGQGAANDNTSAAASERKKKMGKVLAVADARTSSLIVGAARTLMPQIDAMIGDLDAQQGKREIVSYFELRNADPQDISQNLQDLFSRSGRSQNNDQNTFLGRNHPLTQRALQNQQSSASSSTASAGTGGAQGANAGRTVP